VASRRPAAELGQRVGPRRPVHKVTRRQRLDVRASALGAERVVGVAHPDDAGIGKVRVVNRVSIHSGRRRSRRLHGTRRPTRRTTRTHDDHADAYRCSKIPAMMTPHPFRPLRATLWMTCRCARTNMTSTGTLAMTAPAITSG